MKVTLGKQILVACPYHYDCTEAYEVTAHVYSVREVIDVPTFEEMLTKYEASDDSEPISGEALCADFHQRLIRRYETASVYVAVESEEGSEVELLAEMGEVID